MARHAHWISDPSATSVAFGPFRVFPLQRLLTRKGDPVRIGSRAFEILLALLERPGELVTSDALIARVWPSTFVAQANLAVQIAGLRRALGDGVGQSRYVINSPGRGYRFVAPVTVEAEFSSDAPAAAPKRASAVPLKAVRAAKDGDGILALTHELQQRGALTLAPQGGGKGAVALAVVEKLLGGDRNGVWLLDLRSLGEG
jgi:DNA-binding winged helix-turn-helix (wHTH) protein